MIWKAAPQTQARFKISRCTLSPSALEVIGGRGNFETPGSIVNVKSREYHGPVTSADRRLLVLMQDVVAHKRAGNTELHVRFKIHIVVHINLRDVSLVALLENEEMQMRGSHVVAALKPDQIPHRAINWNWITGRPYSAKGDPAIARRF